MKKLLPFTIVLYLLSSMALYSCNDWEGGSLTTKEIQDHPKDSIPKPVKPLAK